MQPYNHTMSLSGKNIVLGVCGSIAAYKAVELLRLLTLEGANVDVIMTANSKEFIGPLTFQTLSKNPVVCDMFTQLQTSDIKHVSLAKKADLFIIAPASANFVGKAAAGIADDMLTTTVMATSSPILICPAMETKMFENPIFQENKKKLKGLGFYFIEPAYGLLASGAEGRGRLAQPTDILEEVFFVLSPKKFSGKRVLVTAGPTQEFFDPVRFISNPSSGKMGYALARVARRMGADVVLISGPTNLPSPNGVSVVRVTTAHEMREATLRSFKEADITIMAAAVSDYGPGRFSEGKIKKDETELNVSLLRNPDILKELGGQKTEGRLLIGFAAETDGLMENAVKKMRTKKLDMIVVNKIGEEETGFGSDKNLVNIIDKKENVEETPLLSKIEIARIILEKVSEMNDN